jgi:FKBP-type peptidyl-prolyl cis-trans isomerase
MARKRDRIFALTLAIVFFITAFGFSFWVIWELVYGNNADNNSTNNTTTQTPPTNTTAQSCPQSPTEAAITVPSVYKTTATVTSLQTTDITVGTGAAAKDGDCLIMKYYGTIANTGVLFDENFDKTTGFGFTLGQGAVIKGWDQGLVGMKVGGERRLVIPPSLGYGSQAQSSIPANSTLVFDVKLLKIQ